MKHTLQSIYRPLKTRVEYAHLVRGKRLQYIVSGALTWRRTADPNFDPYKPRRSKGLNHRSHAIVAPVPSISFDAETSYLQIQIVMDENEIIWCQIQLAE